MKISRVEVLCANRAVYAKVYTDNGLYGIGESGAWGLLAASGEAIKMFGEYLVGQDPLDIEHHWQYMYRFSHFRGAAVMGAISALDEALYDIAGKFYGVPVYRLLGGKCRDKVRVYNHTAGRTEEELIENAIKGKEEGFTALGHLNPYLDEPRNQPFHDNNTQMLYNAERRIARVREAVGEDTDLCLELHRRLEPGLAVQLSARLEPYAPMFLEDPIRPDNFDEMARVAQQCQIPIATGERINSLFEFEMLLERVLAAMCALPSVSVEVLLASRRLRPLQRPITRALCPTIRSVRSRPMRCCSSVQRPTISQFVNTRIRMRRPLPII